MTTLVDVLKAGRKRIEKGWCQHSNARDANGTHVYADDNSAVSWCVYGAVDDVDYASQILRRAAGIDALAIWNDSPHRTQAEVLSLFDKAIALAEKEAQP